MLSANIGLVFEYDLWDSNRRVSTTTAGTSKLSVAMAAQPASEDICIVGGANERVYLLFPLKTTYQYASHFMMQSDNYSSVLSRKEKLLLGEARSQDSEHILIIRYTSKTCEYLSQLPRDGVGRPHHVILADVLHTLLNHHKYLTDILSQLLNMNKEFTSVNVYETEGYIHSSLKDRSFCASLKHFDVTNVPLVFLYKPSILWGVSEEVWQKANVSDFRIILSLSRIPDNINRNDGALRIYDHQKDKPKNNLCVDSNIVQFVWPDTPFVIRCVVNINWNSVERLVFRSWHFREMRLELPHIVKLGDGHVTCVLKRILEHTRNTQTLTKHQYGLNGHNSGISNDVSEVRLRAGWHQLAQILLLLTEILRRTKRLVDNNLPKRITTDSIVFNDDKHNVEDDDVQNDDLSTTYVREQKADLHSLDQMQALYIYNDTSQYMSETHEEDVLSSFDKREAYNLFQNVSDKNFECTSPSFEKKAGELLKYVVKDSLYGDGFTRYVNTWQEVRVAPFYSLRHYFRKLETGENDEKMRYEALRLGSFCGININAFCIRLAEGGFYATGDGDETRCFSCGVRHRGWQQKDNPFLIHRQISPLCPFITGNDRRNVPINPNAEATSCSVLSAVANPVAGGDAGFASDANTNEVLSNQAQVSETYPSISTVGYVSCDGGDKEATASSDRLHPSDRAATDAGQAQTPYILNFEDAVYPTYSDNKVRMESFQMWPQHHCKRPEELVPVGFFYAGYSDCVRCFVCGVGLKTWEEGDDPWVEHVRWRSSCAYVKAIKGDVFVRQTLGVVGQKFRTQQTSTNSQSRRAEIVSTRNDSDDILEREECQRALEMGYSRDCVRKHALYLHRNQGSDSLKLHVLVERILLEEVTETQEPAAANIQATSATPTESHRPPVPGEQTDEPASLPQEDSLPGQQQAASYGKDDGYSDTDEPNTLSSGDKYQSMPILPSDRNRIRSTRTAKVKAQNKATENVEITEEETQQLRQSSACKICLEDPANIVFLPCGHLVACAMCAPALERCPVCRKHIRGSVRVHLADMASFKSS